jgi:hypothetical protein
MLAQHIWAACLLQTQLMYGIKPPLLELCHTSASRSQDSGSELMTSSHYMSLVVALRQPRVATGN